MRVDPVVLGVPVNWRVHAACVDMPLDVFFPQPGPDCATNIKIAKKVCHTCPVKTECLEFAMSFEDKACPGIYGGTTERERRKIHWDRMRRVTVRTIR